MSPVLPIPGTPSTFQQQFVIVCMITMLVRGFGSLYVQAPRAHSLFSRLQFNHFVRISRITHVQSTHEDKDYVHIAMELCAGGELFDSIVEAGSFSEKKAAIVFRKMVEVSISVLATDLCCLCNAGDVRRVANIDLACMLSIF